MFGFGAATTGTFDGRSYLFGQLMVTAAQITAHYVNEYADVGADRLVVNRTMFSGGSGVLSSGEMGSAVALRAALVSSAVAVVAAALLAADSPAAALFGLMFLVVSWLYSMPPVRLLGTGWGELATSAVIAGLIPLIGATALGGPVTAVLWWGIAVLFPIHMAMMLAFEIPDLGSDAAAGKRVVAVRIGRRRTERLIAALLVLAGFVAVEAVAAGGLERAAWLWLAPALVAGGAAGALTRTDRWGWMTAAGVATLVLAGAGLTLAVLV